MDNLSLPSNPPALSAEVCLTAPESCTLIESPEIAIQYFRGAISAFNSGKNVHYDLSNTIVFSEPSIALLIAQIRDRNINKGRITKVTLPKDANCKKFIQKFSIFKKMEDDVQNIASSNMPIQKVSNLRVANETAKNITKLASKFVYGQENRVKELYSTLIECMANTNNHAAPAGNAKYSWMLFTYPDQAEKSIRFIFLDLGLGIFESLPVKQYITRNPYPIASFRGAINIYQRGQQLEEIFSALADGKIKSSTGLQARGRGLPLIIENAKSGHFKEFTIISNDAYIDVTRSSVSAMNENLQGTLLFFEFAHKHGPLL